MIAKYPEVLKCIPLLLAVRANEIYCQDENGGHLYQFDFGKYPQNSHMDYERYVYFMEHTALFDLLENHIINNLVDYVTGVETGLDSNGRKNRGGHLMEDLVESFIQKAGMKLHGVIKHLLGKPKKSTDLHLFGLLTEKVGQVHVIILKKHLMLCNIFITSKI